MEWISVEDQLPKDDDCWVLVYADGAMNCMAYYENAWRDWTEAACHNIDPKEITHWMPLPKPPVVE